MTEHLDVRRVERLSRALDDAQANGLIDQWQIDSPGSGRRWIVNTIERGSHDFTTREAEAFVAGIALANAKLEGEG